MHTHRRERTTVHNAPVGIVLLVVVSSSEGSLLLSLYTRQRSTRDAELAREPCAPLVLRLICENSFFFKMSKKKKLILITNFLV